MEKVNMRVRSKDLELIDRAAVVEGKSRSAFLRDSAEVAARKIVPVDDAETFAEKAYNAFRSICVEPPPPWLALTHQERALHVWLVRITRVDSQR